MTIAVSLKVNEGLVLATDSASTLMVGRGRNARVYRVYNNANKITNLYKGLPIAFMSWDSGNIGPATVSTLAKDLRRRLSGRDSAHADWKIDPNNYTIQDVADKTKAFFFTEQYRTHYSGRGVKPGLGILIGGYSTGAEFPEEYRIDIQKGKCKGPDLWKTPETYGVSWDGQPEALTRLIFGISTRLPQTLVDRLGVPASDVPAIMQVLREALQVDFVEPYMPLQDAIDLASYLVEVSVGYTRFSPGPDTVGGPIEVAAISKHEGFKWIQRKHYFSPHLNPPFGAEMAQELTDLRPSLQELAQLLHAAHEGGESA